MLHCNQVMLAQTAQAYVVKSTQIQSVDNWVHLYQAVA